jgi:outer membrane protein OmpA-like peptidoglycan-associated protein
MAATLETRRWTFSGDVGLQLQPVRDLANLSNADTLTIGLASGFLVTDGLGINLGVFAAIPFVENEIAGTDAPGEVIVSTRHRPSSGLFWTVGGATALTRGASAAEYRVFLGGGWGPPLPPSSPPVVDVDLDGIVDTMDACPVVVEVVNAYSDMDGCPDELATLQVGFHWSGGPVADALIQVNGAGAIWEERIAATTHFELAERMPATTYNARVLGKDCLVGEASTVLGEGVTPLVVELQQVLDAAAEFTVLDRQGRPIQNAEIAWDWEEGGCVPLKKGVFDQNGRGRQQVGPGKHSYRVTAEDYGIYRDTVEIQAGEIKTVPAIRLPPAMTRCTADEIKIKEKVYFATNSATIQERSFDLLNEMAERIPYCSEIQLLEIGGHTDAQGPDDANLLLSQRRADAVEGYLIERGVQPERLRATGYGETRFVGENRTARGREANRRVEFRIEERESAP